MASEFKLIIFDCDGTLVDSETLNNQATIDVLESLGVADYTLEHAFNHWMGTTYTSIRLAVQMETGRMLPDDFVQRCVGRVAELQASSLRPVSGAIDLVTHMQKKYKSCVASNGERKNVLNALHLTGLADLFPESQVFTKNQVERPKPAPDLFLFAAHQMAVDPHHCLVIEDSDAGVTAGVAAGMTVIGFTGSSHDSAMQEKRLKNAGAHHVVTDLIHISSLIEG